MKNWQIQIELDILKDVWFNFHAASKLQRLGLDFRLQPSDITEPQ